MKRFVTVLLPVAMIVTTLTAIPAFAYATEVMDAEQSYKDAVKVREVNYTCQNKKNIKVTYGFNKQSLPTYAQAYLNGKTRFLPVNLGRSDDVDTVFGDEDNFSIMSGVLNLNNYHKASVNIQDASGKILYKGCTVSSAKKIKG